MLYNIVTDLACLETVKKYIFEHGGEVIECRTTMGNPDRIFLAVDKLKHFDLRELCKLTNNMTDAI